MGQLSLKWLLVSGFTGIAMVCGLGCGSGQSRSDVRAKFEQVSAMLPEVKAKAEKLGILVPEKPSQDVLKLRSELNEVLQNARAVTESMKSIDWMAFDKVRSVADAKQAKVFLAQTETALPKVENVEAAARRILPKLMSLGPVAHADSFGFGSLSTLKSIAKFRNMRGTAKVFVGDIDGAFVEWRNAMILVDLVGGWSGFIPKMLALAMVNSIHGNLRFALPVIGARAEYLKLATTLLENSKFDFSAEDLNSGSGEDFRFMVENPKDYEQAAKDQAAGKLAWGESSGKPLKIPSGVKGVDIANAFFVRALQPFIEAHDVFRERNSYTTQIKRLKDITAKYTDESDPTLASNDFIGSSLNIMPQVVAQWQFNKQGMSLLLEIVRYQNSHNGEFPNSIAQFKGNFRDPFDDQPIRYRKEKGGVVLWSVGPDLHDNNGTKRQIDGEGETVGEYDFVLQYPSSPR